MVDTQLVRAIFSHNNKMSLPVSELVISRLNIYWQPLSKLVHKLAYRVIFLVLYGQYTKLRVITRNILSKIHLPQVIVLNWKYNAINQSIGRAIVLNLYVSEANFRSWNRISTVIIWREKTIFMNLTKAADEFNFMICVVVT